MSYNLRHDNPRDGVNAWPHRRELAAETLRAAACDFIGFQEVLPHQWQHLHDDLPAYRSIGRTRDAELATGEATPLFYRHDRWEPTAEQGTFWMSLAPQQPASKAWDSGLPRIVTWARMRRLDGGAGLLVYNTHLDHTGAEARRQGALMIVQHAAAQRREREPVLVMGDFNATPGSLPLAAFDDAGFVDAHRATRQDTGGTFHGWHGNDGAHDRIDYILTHGPIRPTAAETLRTHREAVYLSDHFPVQADFVLDDQR